LALFSNRKKGKRLMKKGIAIGGNILVDYLKQIGFYPAEGMLSPIRFESMSVGGCVSNTGISLKRLEPLIEVLAIGCIGEDHAGDYIKETFKKNGINTAGIQTLNDLPTGYTDVFATESTRTFFVNTGASKQFGFEHIDFDRLNAAILHMGYLLLLENMDSADSECGTVLAKTLREAQKRGIKTSIDVVSEDSDRFREIVPAALRYCNYAILNEIEGGRTVGISPRQSDGTLIWENLPLICSALIDLGVSDCVILHSPEMGIWMDSKKEWIGVRSLNLPNGFIKGSVGAGDAFCAGTLYGLYNGLPPDDMLRLANSAAAGCLSSEDSTGGVGALDDMLKLYKQFAPEDDLWKC